MGNDNNLKEINIGVDGSQPFTISKVGVSRKHAKVTSFNVDTCEGIIEDLDSKNGTYILSDRGEWVRVKSPMPFAENTIIRLGGEYGYGVRFMARRLAAKDPKDFRYEFHVMRTHSERINKAQKKLKNRELLRIALLVVAVSVAFVPEAMFPSQYLNGVVNRLAILIPTLVAAWAAWQGKRDQENLDRKRKAYFVCPNPQCNHLLDKNEQERLECSKCGAGYAYVPKNANIITKT